MPDDRLSNLVVRHDELFNAAGSLSVSAGELTVVYSGEGPDALLRLLTGSAAGGGGALRTLRLSAQALTFEAVPPKEADGGAAAGPAAAGAAAAGAEAAVACADAATADTASSGAASLAAAPRVHTCSGSELRDFIAGSEWGACWEVKLQRSTFRDQETLLLTRREAASPARAGAGLPAAGVPATA